MVERDGREGPTKVREGARLWMSGVSHVAGMTMEMYEM